MTASRPHHGGARKGAGRPVGTIRKPLTTVMRVPLALVDAVKKLISEFRQ